MNNFYVYIRRSKLRDGSYAVSLLDVLHVKSCVIYGRTMIHIFTCVDLHFLITQANIILTCHDQTQLPRMQSFVDFMIGACGLRSLTPASSRSHLLA